METLLEVKNLNKFFKKKQILNNVSFELREGEILGFIGPNGAGKTTTIKLILGLQSISSGEVIINGYNVKNDFVKAIEKVGAIVENPDLYMYLTGRENLELCLRAHHLDYKDEKIEELVKMVGLEQRIDDKVSKYSLGMRQRLGIAISLIHHPKILILDEPTNGLDPEGIKELRILLKKMAKTQKMGILISSHNLAELESFCTDVCLIKNGIIVANTSVKDIVKDGSSSYLIKMDNVRNIDNEIKYKYEIVDDLHIKIYCEEKDIPGIIKKLINGNFNIYGIKEYNLSLEEAFLRKTGGNKID